MPIVVIRKGLRRLPVVSIHIFHEGKLRQGTMAGGSLLPHVNQTSYDRGTRAEGSFNGSLRMKTDCLSPLCPLFISGGMFPHVSIFKWAIVGSVKFELRKFHI
ncbi:hypothetical protein ACOSQ3_005130 [Xanthoceras sorbifolium]